MNPEQSFGKTRIAPTPSGFLHLGNVLSFAITATLARRTGAGILLRIDDLDRERARRKYVQDIFDTLNFLEIPWDEGPGNYEEYEKQYAQRHRMELYTRALQELKDSGKVFACECSRATVAKTAPDGVYPGTCRNKMIPFGSPDASWRLITDPEKRGIVTGPTLPANMKDFVIKKKDGYPAYQLASVVDDQYFGIDLVVRGKDLWPSTIAQHYLSGLLSDHSFQDCGFYHHGLLMTANGGKLSKSEGATSIRFLRNEGKRREDIYSLLAAILEPGETASDYEELAEIAFRWDKFESSSTISVISPVIRSI